MSDEIRPYELISKRADKAKRNDEITPLQLLQSMVDDIQTGKICADGMVIVWCERPKDKNWTFGRYRSNLTKDAECTMLRIAEHRALQGWID